MNKSLIILVDLDNVIADQMAGFYQAIRREYPDIILPDRAVLTEFNFELNFPPGDHKKVTSLRLREGFFRDLPLNEGAREGLARLTERTTQVRIVTAPTWEWKFCVPEKYAWVEKNLGTDWTGKLILTRDKTLIKGDILIDDSPSVSGVASPEWTHVLYDQPYNRTIDASRVTWDTMDDVLDAWMEKSSRSPR